MMKTTTLLRATEFLVYAGSVAVILAQKGQNYRESTMHPKESEAKMRRRIERGQIRQGLELRDGEYPLFV